MDRIHRRLEFNEAAPVWTLDVIEELESGVPGGISKDPKEGLEKYGNNALQPTEIGRRDVATGRTRADSTEISTFAHVQGRVNTHRL